VEPGLGSVLPEKPGLYTGTGFESAGELTKKLWNLGSARLSMSTVRVDFSILWPKFQQSMATDPRKAGVDLLRL